MTGSDMFAKESILKCFTKDSLFGKLSRGGWGRQRGLKKWTIVYLRLIFITFSIRIKQIRKKQKQKSFRTWSICSGTFLILLMQTKKSWTLSNFCTSSSPKKLPISVLNVKVKMGKSTQSFYIQLWRDYFKIH